MMETPTQASESLQFACEPHPHYPTKEAVCNIYSRSQS